MQEYAIVDIETTGTNASWHGITEIAVLTHDGSRITGNYHSLVNPQQYIPSFITQLTGITNEMIESAPTFEEISAELHAVLHNKIFVAHNAGFDYGFIKSNLENCGYEFKAKKLCTVRLSRKLFPGFRSYSLGKLCDALGVKNNDRHRAMGDAQATADIFGMLLRKDTEGVIEQFLKRNAKEQHLPPNLDKKVLELLPEKPGVYYFHDAEGTIIYVGKARNIKNRVQGHFTYADNNGKENALRNAIHHITYELTGNELIALLLESEEIKRKFPRYNNAQKLWDRNYCIFRYTDQNGYVHLAIERFNRKKDVLKVFPDFLSARNFLHQKVIAHRLCAKYAHLQTVRNQKQACHNHELGFCDGACIGLEDTESYNGKIYAAIETFDESESTYYVIGKGRTEVEKSVVYVEKGHYLGFGFFDENTHRDWNEIKDVIKWRPDTPDVQRILTGYLSRNSKDIKIIRATATEAALPYE